MSHWPSEKLNGSSFELPNEFKRLEKVLVENGEHDVLGYFKVPSLKIYHPTENVLPPTVPLRSYSVKEGEMLLTADDFMYLTISQGDNVMVNYEPQVKRVEIMGRKVYNDLMKEHFSK